MIKNYDIPGIIFVTGIPGSGKSETARFMSKLLTNDGFEVFIFTDKQTFEMAVRADIMPYLNDLERKNSDGSVRGDHCTVINPQGSDGTLRVNLHDGHPLNYAHQMLFDYAEKFLIEKQGRQILILELAYGGDVEFPGEPLRQTGSGFTTELIKRGLPENSIFIDILASMETREKRNRLRPGHIPTGDFRLYFKDEGHFQKEDILRLGEERFTVIMNDNSSIAYLGKQVCVCYQEFILPWIKGEGSEETVEGVSGLFLHSSKEGC